MARRTKAELALDDKASALFHHGYRMTSHSTRLAAVSGRMPLAELLTDEQKTAYAREAGGCGLAMVWADTWNDAVLCSSTPCRHPH